MDWLVVSGQDISTGAWMNIEKKTVPLKDFSQIKRDEIINCFNDSSTNIIIHNFIK